MRHPSRSRTGRDAVLDLGTGKVIGSLRATRAIEFKKFLRHWTVKAADMDVHVVLDNARSRVGCWGIDG